jgi:uncharacterized small protein (DUF1192 family)
MQTIHRSTLVTSLSLALGTLAAIATPAWSQASHFLSGVRGDVVVGRYLISPDRAFNGRSVSGNHRIRVGSGGRVTLNCSNGSRYTLTSGTYRVSRYCPATNSRRDRPINTARDPFKVDVPYVISPRNTALLSGEAMTLRWNPVAGATEYTVSIQGEGVDWTTTVPDTSVTVPETVSFEPNYTYSVTVMTDTGLSSAEGIPVRFAVVPIGEATRIQAQVADIACLCLEPDEETIAIALLYLEFQNSDPDWDSYALNQAALDVLTARIEAGTQSAQVYLLQGEAYQTMGLPLLAQDAFQQGLALAEATEQQELQAQAHLGLAAVAARQTEYRAALEQLAAALTLYEVMEDEERVTEVQDRIEAVEAQLP